MQGSANQGIIPDRGVNWKSTFIVNHTTQSSLYFDTMQNLIFKKRSCGGNYCNLCTTVSLIKRVVGGTETHIRFHMHVQFYYCSVLFRLPQFPDHIFFCTYFIHDERDLLVLILFRAMSKDVGLGLRNSHVVRQITQPPLPIQFCFMSKYYILQPCFVKLHEKKEILTRGLTHYSDILKFVSIFHGKT